MYNVGAKLNWFETTRSTSDTLIISSVYKCIEKVKNPTTYVNIIFVIIIIYCFI